VQNRRICGRFSKNRSLKNPYYIIYTFYMKQSSEKHINSKKNPIIVRFNRENAQTPATPASHAPDHGAGGPGPALSAHSPRTGENMPGVSRGSKPLSRAAGLFYTAWGHEKTKNLYF
jgi:hypothetical protein